MAVYGISFDQPSVSSEWAERMGFPFVLLSDPQRVVGGLMGVRREEGSPGEYTARRVTYVVDPDGIVRLTYRVREPGPHPEELLKDLQALLGPAPRPGDPR